MADPWKLHEPTAAHGARDAGHVTLVKGGLRAIALAGRISTQTVSRMREKLGFALVCKALGVPIDAGVLSPGSGLLVSPLIAALAMRLRAART